MASTLDKARLWFLSVAAKFRKPCRNSNRSIPKSPRGAKTSNSKLLQAKKIENNKVTGARNDFDAVDAVGMYFAFKWVDSLWNHKQSVDENNHKELLNSKQRSEPVDDATDEDNHGGGHGGGASASDDDFFSDIFDD